MRYTGELYGGAPLIIIIEVMDCFCVHVCNYTL